MIDWTQLEKRRKAGKLKPGDVAGTCVVCNGTLYIGESGRYVARHDCPKRVVGAREAADNRDGSSYDPERDTPYGQKLADAEDMVHGEDY